MQSLHRFLKDESGQAITEFFLVLLVTVGLVTFLKTNLKSLTIKFWTFMAKKIAAPCPACDAGTDFNL